MIKAYIINRVAEDARITKVKAVEAVEAVFDAICTRRWSDGVGTVSLRSLRRVSLHKVECSRSHSIYIAPKDQLYARYKKLCRIFCFKGLGFMDRVRG